MNKTIPNLLLDANISAYDGIGRATYNILYSIFDNKEISQQINLIASVKDIFSTKNEIIFDDTSPYTINEFQRKSKLIQEYTPYIFHAFDYRIPLNPNKTKIVTSIYDIFRYTNCNFCYSDEIFITKFGKKTFSELDLISDLIQKKLKNKKSIYKSKHHRYYSLYLEWAIQRSDEIIVPSHHVKNQIEKNFNGFGTINIIPLGINHKKFNNKFNDISIPPNYILYVGQSRKHKNITQIIKVYNKINDQDSSIKLVLVGKDFEPISSNNNKLFDNINKNNIFLLGMVSDQQLENLYSNAFCLLHLASEEGFGFTPLEGFLKGTPCIALDSNFSLKESLGDLAYFVKKNDYKKIINIINTIRNESDEIKNLRINHAKQYTWQSYVNQLWKIYKKYL